MEKYLIDTNIFIKLLRKNQDSKMFLESFPIDKMRVSYITLFELIAGCKTKEQYGAIETIMNNFTVDYGSESTNVDAIKLYMNNHLTKGLSTNDSIIAVTCLQNGYKLITENIKDFKFIKDLEVYNLEDAIKNLL